MAFREKVFDNLVGDLEYHPKRAVLYLGLCVAALSVWAFAPPGHKVDVVRIVFAAGGLALLLKGVFLLRKTSDGFAPLGPLLDLRPPDVPEPFPISAQRAFPPVPVVVAQLTQDFGAGAFLLGPFLHVANDVTDYTHNLPSFQVFLSGACLFLAGWLIRRLAPPPHIQG
jgi:hypothetical protein